jgi:hypothetical protein
MNRKGCGRDGLWPNYMCQVPLYGGTNENHEILSDDIVAPVEILGHTFKNEVRNFPLELNCSLGRIRRMEIKVVREERMINYDTEKQETLGSWVQIPLESWMSSCVFSVFGCSVLLCV